MQLITSLAFLSSYAVFSTLPSATAFQVGSQGRVMWKDNCDFCGNDYRAVRGIPNVCGDMCANDGACSHWSWSNFNGGTCWLKTGGSGTTTNVYGTDCGYVIGRFEKSSQKSSQSQQLQIKEVGGDADNGRGSSSNNGLDAVELQTMLNSINAYRSQNGLAGLRVDKRLSAASIVHAQDQANRCYMTHDSVDGSKAWDRMKAQGYATRTAAENVAAGQKSVESVMESWWNSPGHRANILSDKVKDVGFAKAVNSNCGNYQTYWTQDFGSTG